MKPRRPNYSHDFIGIEYGDELKFKHDPSIRARVGKDPHGVILEGVSYSGTNISANAAFKQIGMRERKSVSNGFFGVRNWIHVPTGKSLLQLWEEACGK